MWNSKYILLSLFLTSTFSVQANAQTQCANYWIDPKTGQEQCLDNLGRQTTKSSPYPGYVFLTESAERVKTYIQEKTRRIGIVVYYQTIAVDASGNTLTASNIADCKSMMVGTRFEVLRSPQGKILYQKKLDVPSYEMVTPGTTGMSEWNYACFGKLPAQP